MYVINTGVVIRYDHAFFLTNSIESAMAATVAQIISILEKIAPSRLAEDWDNVGLQIGQKDWPVQTVWVALDPDPEVVNAACEKGVDLLVTHHPLLFKPLHRIDWETPTGVVIRTALENRLTVYSAHTNLDKVSGGVNDVLTERIGLTNVDVLESAPGPNCYKLVVFVPEDHVAVIVDAICQTEAGQIGAYSCCSFRSRGKGTFKSGDSSRPFIGRPGEVNEADEVRIETVVPQVHLADVLAHIRRKHPYETMAYDVYPLASMDTGAQGMGRIGDLKKTIDFRRLAQEVKTRFGLESIRLAGKPDLAVKRIAICSGSGSGMMKTFLNSNAQVYISGDLRYHDAKDAQALNRGLIDIGHFASEHLIVESLVHRLETHFAELGINAEIMACKSERDPFDIL